MAKQKTELVITPEDKIEIYEEDDEQIVYLVTRKKSMKEKIKKLANDLYNVGFTDFIDTSPEISLLEYGVLRNPETGDVVYCQEHPDREEYLFDYSNVSYEEVKEDAESRPKYFFDFCSLDKETVLRNLEQNHAFLCNFIENANAFYGLYQQSCTWDFDVDDIRHKFIISPDG